MKIRVESQDQQLLKDLQRAIGGALSRSRAPYQRQWGARTLWALSISGTPALSNGDERLAAHEEPASPGNR
jgi:hypothetical protein